MRGLLLVLAACGGGGGVMMMNGDGNPGGDAAHGSADAPISIDTPPAVCGDGMRVRGEECDDHNTASGDGCDSSCRVEPYAGAPQAAIDALHAMNALRAAADLPGAQLDSHAVQSSQAHASYYADNAAAYAGGLSPHLEDASFPSGFTGVQFYDRMTAAGFTGQAFFETMAFSDNATSAVAQWENTVFHRIAMLHPNMTVFGYGGSNANGRSNDVCDYGSGTAEQPGAVIVWPPPGASGVTRTFNTAQEGPTPPPAPGNMTTTGPIISVLFANGASGSIASHTITDSGGNMVAHTTITPSDATFGPYMSGSYAMYGAPPSHSETYTVAITGTVNGGPFTMTWSFSTQ